jgi:hypothetical protein
VQLRRRPAGAAASWQPPEEVAPFVDHSVFGSRPDLVVDGSGAITVVWNEPAGSGDVVRAVSAPPGGAFGPKIDLSAPSTGTATSVLGGPLPRLAVDGAGNVTAVWTQLAGNGSASPSWIQTADRPRGSSSWTAAKTLSWPLDTSGFAQIVSNSAGDLAVLWLHEGLASQPAQRALRPAGGSWSWPADLWSLGYSFADELGIDDAGHVTYAWLLTVDSIGFLGTVEADSESVR